jgi:hypothetical protein
MGWVDMMKKEPPWKTARLLVTDADIALTAVLHNQPLLWVQQFYAEYAEKFREGPQSFIPWYLEKRREEGGLTPPYVHEVFDVMSDNHDWLYRHPAWASAHMETAV